MTSQQRRREPKLRLHKPTGKGRVILSGQHFYTRAPFDTPEAYEEYLKLLKRWKENGRRPLREVRSAAEVLNPHTVQHLVSAYESYIDGIGKYRKSGSPTSHRGKIAFALRELVQASGTIPLRHFRKSDLIRHRDHLMAKRRLTTSGINCKIAIIKRMIRWGAERDHLPEDDAIRCGALAPLQTPKKRRRQPVPEEHVLRILQHVSPTLQAMVRLQWLTGMRPGEVCAMRWTDIDQDPAGPTGEQGHWLYVVNAPKTEHHGFETSYILNQDCQRILHDFVKTPAAFLFSPKDTVGQRWPRGAEQFRSEAGDHYTSQGYRQAIRRACERAGVPVFTPHQIRHSFITQGANDPAIGPAAVGAAVNHQSLQSTLNYVHTDKALALRVAGSMRDIAAQ